ncbi:XRE family transcriptional regulator [Enterococcus casseliflavus]|uniref:XRE family transcriptional regulator n=1 Tax=Enterococcus casseliflavus TaxID=37734 RepID=A0A415ELY3_ENTCA|nr:XRE family transcriptional regulator [Enterococcus casseliflavus]
MGLIKLIRKSQELKQTQMAKRLNISYSHYVKLENGFVNPSFKVLQRIKKEFKEVDMNEFFR